MNGTIEYDYQTSTVSFDVGSVMDVMKTVEVPGVVLTSTASPSSWVEMNNVTMQKALWFFLRWHTTVMMSTDVQYLGTNYMMFRFESDNAKIGDILITFMQTAVIGSAVANRQGQLFFETDPIAIHNAPTVLPLIASLDRNYWMDKVEIQQAVDPEVSYVEMYGYSYSSVTGSSTIYRACAPGVTPSSAGNMEEFNGMSVNNQQEINRIVGDIYAYRNATYPNIGMALKGHYPELEFVPNQKYYLTIESNDSWSHVRETNLPIHPTTLVWKYDPLNLFYAPEAEFHEITVGTSGTTLHIPDTTFDNPAWIPTEFDIPPWTPYNFPPWNPPLIPPEPPALAGCENWNDPPENSYAAYPEFPILGPTRPYTYIWFPCVVRKYPLFDWSKQSYIEVDSTDNSGFYSVDVVRQDKSIIYSASMTPHPYPVSIGIFTPAAYIEAAGFKINWNYHDPTYPYIIGLNAGGYSAIIGVWDGWAGWQTSPGKSMGFVEAEANLSNWPHITPWGTGWYVHLTGSYAGVTQERIQIKKLSGGAEAIVLIPGSYYIAGTDEFFKGGYNMHAAASLTLTSPGDTGYRGETAHAAITYSGNYCFGIGSYWDDAFAPTPHASSYQILALELYYSGAWHVVWGPGVETGTISTRIQNVYIYNICPPIS